MTGVQGDQNVSRSPHEFQFINIGNAANLEDSSKARIRAHAMRDFHRRKLKQEISGQDDAHAPSGSSAAPDIHQQSHKFRLGPWGLQQRPFRARASRQKRLVPSLPSQRENVPETGVLQQLDSSVNSQIRQLHPLSSKLEGPGRRPTDGKAPSPVQTQLPETEQSVRQILTADDEDDAALLENWEEDDDFFEMQTLQIGLGAGSGDPFGTIPYLNSQPLQNLLHYTHVQAGQPSIMTNLRQNWVLMATKDPAFCYAVLSQYSEQYSSIRKDARIADPLPHISKAIEMVNSRLGDPDLATCDGTIGAVASIVNYEIANGTLSGVKTHMNGLKQMVTIRGGLQDPGLPHSLRRKVAWADINAATVLSEDPVLPPIECPSRHLLLGHFSPVLKPASLSKNASIYGHNPEFGADLEVWREEVEGLFVELRHLADIFASDHHLKLPEMDRILYSDWVYSVKRRLLSLSKNSDNNVTTNKQIEAACCTAALIVVETCFRGIRLDSQVIAGFVTTQLILIQTVLRDVSFIMASPSAAKALLWALFVSGCVSQRKERHWFVAQLAWFCWLLDIDSWEDVEVVLSKILWHSRWDIPYKMLWADVKSTLATTLDEESWRDSSE